MQLARPRLWRLVWRALLAAARAGAAAPPYGRERYAKVYGGGRSATATAAAKAADEAEAEAEGEEGEEGEGTAVDPRVPLIGALRTLIAGAVREMRGPLVRLTLTPCWLPLPLDHDPMVTKWFDIAKQARAVASARCSP